MVRAVSAAMADTTACLGVVAVLGVALEVTVTLSSLPLLDLETVLDEEFCFLCASWMADSMSAFIFRRFSISQLPSTGMVVLHPVLLPFSCLGVFATSTESSSSWSKNVSLLTPSSWSSSSSSRLLPSLMLKTGAVEVILSNAASARSLSAFNLEISSNIAFSLWAFSARSLSTSPSPARSLSSSSLCLRALSWDRRVASACSLSDSRREISSCSSSF
mmetsp:Transcript_29103/g.61777  ORF Transcript_29103/g.61777 Transcript_29103/m.61777 type:complete len:218 (+) Transcript_29103:251-904(+)